VLQIWKRWKAVGVCVAGGLEVKDRLLCRANGAGRSSLWDWLALVLILVPCSRIVAFDSHVIRSSRSRALSRHVPRIKESLTLLFFLNMQVRSCLPDTAALPSVSRFASLRSDVMHPSSTAAGYGGFSAGALGAQSGAQSRNVVGERKDSRQYEQIPTSLGCMSPK